VAALAAHEGADVTIADVNPGPLARAEELASLRALDANDLPGEEFEMAVEASGAPSALARCIQLTRRDGAVVCVGMFPVGSTAGPDPNGLVTREIELRGSFRFTPEEFRRAVELLAEGGVDPEPLLTAVVPLAEGVDAFRLAADRDRASKVLLRLAD
jgi:L-idonate 5-dehydrogenase